MMTPTDYERESVISVFCKLQEFITACEMQSQEFKKALSDRIIYLHQNGYDKEDKEVREFLSKVLEFISI